MISTVAGMKKKIEKQQQRSSNSSNNKSQQQSKEPATEFHSKHQSKCLITFNGVHLIVGSIAMAQFISLPSRFYALPIP